jgi:hypothetical protein
MADATNPVGTEQMVGRWAGHIGEGQRTLLTSKAALFLSAISDFVSLPIHTSTALTSDRLPIETRD